MLRFNKNIKIFLNFFAGPVLFVWLAISIYHQVISQPHLRSSWLDIQHALRGKQNWMFWMVLALMAVNWGVEARKWQVVIRPAERIPWLRALKATLAGMALAINTPNRIGEYGGRVLFIHQGNRLKVVSLTVMSSMSQLLVTLIIGCGGLRFLLHALPTATYPVTSASYLFWIQVVFYIVTLISFLGLLVYFRLSWLVRLLDKVPAFSKIAFHIAVLEDLNALVLLRVLSLSFTRYIIFVTQYVLMMRLMQVDVTVWQAFWLLSVVFLVLGVVPTIALAEVGLRGEVNLELFGVFSNNHIGIIAVSVGIWAINLVIPAIIGSLLILRTKIFNNR